MKHHIQPTLIENQPDKLLLHVGTKGHSLAKNVDEILSEVMELVDICRRLKIDAIVSQIVSRGDDLNVKGKVVDKCLKEMRKSKNVWFLDHLNIIPGTYLNRSKLHLGVTPKLY